MNIAIEGPINLIDPLWWSAAGTLVLAIATFLTLRWYRKEKKEAEKREIYEKIILPLKKDLREIKGRIEEDLFISSCSWKNLKENNPYLVYSNLFRNLAEKINKFDQNITPLFWISIDSTQKLKDIINEELSNYQPLKACTLSTEEELKNRLSTYDLPLRNYCYAWHYKGKYLNVPVANLIFKDYSLGKRMKELCNGCVIDKEIKDGRCIFANLVAKEIQRDDFEEITFSIKEEVQKDKSLSDYIENCRKVYQKAGELEEELEKFLKSTNF